MGYNMEDKRAIRKAFKIEKDKLCRKLLGVKKSRLYVNADEGVAVIGIQTSSEWGRQKGRHKNNLQNQRKRRNNFAQH